MENQANQPPTEVIQPVPQQRCTREEVKQLYLEHIDEHKRFPKIDSTTTCNGKIHRQFKYCKRPAGAGTSHPGKGRCKLHGGCSPGQPPKSGKLRYSDYVPTAIVEKYEEFCDEDRGDILSLDNEIALIRAKITSIELANQDGRYNKDLIHMTELVRRLVETKQRVETEVKNKTTLDITMKIVDLFIDIVERTVQDMSLKKTIAGELRRLNETELGVRNLN